MEVLHRRHQSGSLSQKLERDGRPTLAAVPSRAPQPPKKAPQRNPVAKLPPKVPRDLTELEAAISLLGAYVKTVEAGSKLRESRQQLLEDLVGCLPRLEDAPDWKLGLKMARLRVLKGEPADNRERSE